MTLAIKNGGCNKYYTALQEARSTFPQTCRERESGGDRGESLSTALSLVETFSFFFLFS